MLLRALEEFLEKVKNNAHRRGTLYCLLILCHPRLQETEWAKVSRRGGTLKPLDSKCKKCVLLVGTAYSTMSWEQVVGRALADCAFKDGLLKAQRVMEGKLDVSFVTEDFLTSEAVTMEVEREMLMLPEADWPSVLGRGVGIAKLQKAGYTIERMRTETGQEVNALLPAAESPFRKVRVKWCGGTYLIDHLHQAPKQVRPGQGRDLAKWYNEDHVKARGASLQAKAVLPSLEDVLKKIKKLDEEQPAAPSQPPQVAAPLASVGLLQVKEEQDKGDIEGLCAGSADAGVDLAPQRTEAAEEEAKGEAVWSRGCCIRSCEAPFDRQERLPRDPCACSTPRR